MKLINKAYKNDYYSNDLDLRGIICGKPAKTRKAVKRHLGKARRQINKDLCREGGAE